MISGAHFFPWICFRELPSEENDVILERDGSWHPVPKDEDKNLAESAAKKNGAAKANKEDNVDCIDLSDDDEIPLPPPLPGNYSIGVSKSPYETEKEKNCIVSFCRKKHISYFSFTFDLCTVNALDLGSDLK